LRDSQEVKYIKEEWETVYDAAGNKSFVVTDGQIGDVNRVKVVVKEVGGVYENVFVKAQEQSKSATQQILSDLEKIKRTASEVKFPSTSGDSPSGFKTGGNPFWGGLPGYGGGDKNLILVERGEHVIRKEAVARLGHGFFQAFNNFSIPVPRIKKFAIGGDPFGSSPTTGQTIRHEHVIRMGSRSATVFTDDMNSVKLIGLLRNSWEMAG